MNVEYSRRALADLEQIATHYRQSDNPDIAAAPR